MLIMLQFPLDTIKTRMQSYVDASKGCQQPQIEVKLTLYRNHYTSVTACVKDTYARDGVRAFWRGESTASSGVVAYEFSLRVPL